MTIRDTEPNLPDGFHRVYELLDPMGQGGCSRVYRARQIALGRAVVVKLLTVEGLHRTGVRRFLEEARILARIRHPRVITLLDFGVEGDLAFLVFPHEPGVSVDLVVGKGRRLDVRPALVLLADVLAGLGHIHQMGVIHRDLKPSNLLFSPDERAKILDFGLAKQLLGDTTQVTAAGAFIGTPAYAAPGRIVCGDSDPRDDLYSMGVIAYEALTGSNPFLGSRPVECLERHLHLSPPPPRSVCPEIPAPLSLLVMDLLAKARDDRPPSAAAALDRLRDFAGDLSALRIDAAPARTSAPRVIGEQADAIREPSEPARAAASLTKGLSWAEIQQTTRIIAPPPDLGASSRPIENWRRPIALRAYVLTAVLAAGLGVWLLVPDEARLVRGPEVDPGVTMARVRWTLDRPTREDAVVLDDGAVQRTVTAAPTGSSSIAVSIANLVPDHRYALWVAGHRMHLSGRVAFRTRPTPSYDALEFRGTADGTVTHVAFRTAYPVGAWLEQEGVADQDSPAASTLPATGMHALTLSGPAGPGERCRIVLSVGDETFPGEWFPKRIEDAVAHALGDPSAALRAEGRLPAQLPASETRPAIVAGKIAKLLGSSLPSKVWAELVPYIPILVTNHGRPHHPLGSDPGSIARALAWDLAAAGHFAMSRGARVPAIVGALEDIAPWSASQVPPNSRDLVTVCTSPIHLSRSDFLPRELPSGTGDKEIKVRLRGTLPRPEGALWCVARLGGLSPMTFVEVALEALPEAGSRGSVREIVHLYPDPRAPGRRSTAAVRLFAPLAGTKGLTVTLKLGRLPGSPVFSGGEVESLSIADGR